MQRGGGGDGAGGQGAGGEGVTAGGGGDGRGGARGEGGGGVAGGGAVSQLQRPQVRSHLPAIHGKNNTLHLLKSR